MHSLWTKVKLVLKAAAACRGIRNAETMNPRTANVEMNTVEELILCKICKGELTDSLTAFSEMVENGCNFDDGYSTRCKGECETESTELDNLADTNSIYIQADNITPTLGNKNTCVVTDDSLDLPVLIENSEVFDMITPLNSQSSSQISSWSQENDIHSLSSINKAMDILGHGKISPIKFKVRTNIEDLKPSTLRYLKRKATTTVHEALDCIAPSQAKKLLQLLHIDKLKYAFAGVPLPNKEKFTRQRIDKGKLEHALDFFFDPTFHQVSSFGTKELKLSSGEVLQIPEVVRTACHSRATLFNILSECPASHRTNLKGLDNIAADGVCAMDTLLEIIANFQNSTVHQNTNFSDIKEKLISYKLYLKTDFKHHLQMKDQCSDQCIQFALSDPTEKKLARSCTDHLHDMKCPRCCLLPDTVIELKRIISEFTDYEENIEKLSVCILHMLPSRFGCRLYSLTLMVLISDEPTSHPRWPSYHRTYVHTIESAKQDWYSVTSVIEHTLKTIKDQMPNIKSVVLRSNNAGCYHCSNLWHSLHGISQRTEGGDIRSSTEMKEALDVYGGVSGCQISNVTIDTESQTKDQSQLKGITKHSNVKIDHDGRLTCWKAFGIGEGQRITMSSFNQEDTNLNVLEDFSLPKHIEGSIKNSNSNVNDQIPREGDLYCPEMTCSRKFKSYSELEDHCFVGDHALCPLHDLIKLQWKGVCLDISSCSVKTREGSLQNGDSTLQSGWGLKRDRKSLKCPLKKDCEVSDEDLESAIALINRSEALEELS
ncbi:unnamed protein product [Mytilus coruscus]|uniref:C2H2-type domain-containing protein n=1 Tax=Mytilus coruscus TaxID=42192 RepID=A0A6J8E0Q8_MYTCO|nr:unnamed protein product [Mytilus coruscus]